MARVITAAPPSLPQSLSSTRLDEEASAKAGASLHNTLETINAPLARRGIYLESLQLRLSGLPRLKYIG